MRWDPGGSACGRIKENAERRRLQAADLRKGRRGNEKEKQRIKDSPRRAEKIGVCPGGSGAGLEALRRKKAVKMGSWGLEEGQGSNLGDG